jgi:hypothetical protein
LLFNFRFFVGPDPIFEYGAFCKNVAETVTPDSKYWNKAICEVLLLQEVFNGIGNYLRAEILHELGVDPFAETSQVLSNLSLANCENHRLLQLCREVPMRFMESPKYGSECVTDESLFKVYSRSDSMSRKDSNGRMVWWKKQPTSSGNSEKTAHSVGDEDEDDDEEKPVKKPKAKKSKKKSRVVLDHERELERIAASSKKARKMKREETEVIVVPDTAASTMTKRQERELAKKIHMKKKARSAVRAQRRRKVK